MARRRSFEQKRATAARKLVSPEEVAERLRARGIEITKLPPHIRGYAEFMAKSARRTPSVREVIKAFVITRSSIRRQSRAKPTVCYGFPEFAELRHAARQSGAKEIRPEDAMSVLLFSPFGERYLDAAERGVLDEQAVAEITKRTTCFGLQNDLAAALRDAVRVGHDPELVRTLRHGDAHAWMDYVLSPRIPGIRAAKAGYFASLLGRGDLPTFDAREIELWRRKKGRDPEKADVFALRDSIARFPMQLDAKYEPFRQHLVHHALWDAYAEGKPTKTTHAAPMHAMALADLLFRPSGSR